MKSLRHRRRGVASIVAIVILGTIVAFSVVIGSFAAQSLQVERRAFAESCAAEALASARAWANTHVAELEAGAVSLPLKNLLPEGATGAVEVCRVQTDDRTPVVECRVDMRIGRDSIRRSVRCAVRGG